MAPERAATPQDVADLVRRAAAGDRDAWERLVDAYVGLVWSIVRGLGVSDSEAADVVQTTWLRFLEHIDRLHDPSRVGAWLATTARRESWRVVAQRKRTVLVGDDDYFFDTPTPDDAAVDARLLRGERAEEVREAFDRLPERWQEIMLLLMADPRLSYDEISELLNVPHGSIGPTRARSLRRLRELVTT